VAVLTEVKVKKLERVFVLGGQVVVTQEPQELVTILGSCVAVCLWDGKKLTGGMNHFLRPETVNDAKSLHGGISATRALVKTMIRKFSHVKNIEAKVYGGANRFFSDESFLNVGGQNVEAAKIILEEQGIPVVFHSTGGESGRKIYFNTLTGVVRVEMIHYDQRLPARVEMKM
jgi:chemotaxis protein CheD